MSDHSTTVEIDESTIDPAIKAFYESKFKGVTDKNAELLGRIGNYKGTEKDIEALGGLEALKALKQQADKANAEAEAARLAALHKDGKVSELEEHYKKLLADKDEKISARDQRLINKEVDSRLAQAIRAEDGNPILLAHALRGRIDAHLDEDGEVVITVKGAAGQTADASGKTLTLEALVAEFKSNKDYAGAFAAHQASGGSTRKGNPASGTNPFAAATDNVTEQMRLIKNEPALARKLATEAGAVIDW